MNKTIDVKNRTQLWIKGDWGEKEREIERRTRSSTIQRSFDNIELLMLLGTYYILGCRIPGKAMHLPESNIRQRHTHTNYWTYMCRLYSNFIRLLLLYRIPHVKWRLYMLWTMCVLFPHMNLGDNCERRHILHGWIPA